MGVIELSFQKPGFFANHNECNRYNRYKLLIYAKIISYRNQVYCSEINFTIVLQEYISSQELKPRSK